MPAGPGQGSPLTGLGPGRAVQLSCSRPDIFRFHNISSVFSSFLLRKPDKCLPHLPAETAPETGFAGPVLLLLPLLLPGGEPGETPAGAAPPACHPTTH